MTQKIIYCAPINSGEPGVSFREINKELIDGWSIVSVTSQVCAITSGGQTYSVAKTYGGFAIVLEKNIKE